MKNLTDRHSKLFFIMLISIIVLLAVGIVYEFVYIKKLERKIDEAQSSQIEIFDEYKITELIEK